MIIFQQHYWLVLYYARRANHFKQVLLLALYHEQEPIFTEQRNLENVYMMIVIMIFQDQITSPRK